MKYVEKECQYCHALFSADLREHNRGNARFCNRSCAAKFHGTLIHNSKIPNVVCAFCEKAFYKAPNKNWQVGLVYTSVAEPTKMPLKE